MGSLKHLIEERGRSLEYCFVFPNNISQQFCFTRAISLLKRPTIPLENYISWNTFIEEHITNNFEKKREKVDDAHRLLYAEYIMAKNAKSAKEGKSLFSKLISPKYAEKSDSFSKWVSSILPQLALFTGEKEYKDDELKDLSFLCSDYAQFLRNNNLFEPNWEQGIFIADEKKYIIIYPELIDDFESYSHLFANRTDIELFHIAMEESNIPSLREFENSYLELKYVASEIEELLLNGEKISNIALSVVDIESMQSYILQEFEKRGIPVDLYTKKPILQNSFCFVFNAIKNVVESHYSFDSIKQLFLNKAVNWKFIEYKSFINELIQFGIEYNCAYSWQEQNVWNNVWEKAFLQQKESKLFTCFMEFKKKIEAIYQATSFKEMDGAIRAFFSEYIDFSNASKTNERALSSYYKIMKDLKRMEVVFGEYFSLINVSPYNFFLAILKTKTIHSDVSGTALSVFPYRAACATFFSHHFVINANQNSSGVNRRKLSFLREDKRDEIGIKDVDLGQYLIASYANMGHISFSYSKKTYQGYCIANNIFKTIEKIDAFHAEDSFWSEEQYFFSSAPINKIYKTQLYAIKRAQAFDSQPNFSLLSKSYSESSSHLLERIVDSQYMESKTSEKEFNRYFSVSATKLEEFFLECPAKFFFSSILKIKKTQFIASMLDRRIIGTIYHSILEKIYKQIMNDYTCFDKNQIDQYKQWTAKIFQEVLLYNSSKYGPLSLPFMKAMQKQIEGVIDYVFSFDEKLFDKCEQYIIEGEYNQRTQKRHLSQFFDKIDEILYVGRIDRALKTDDGFAILDYKTYSSSSEKKFLINDVEIKDFQMPFYVFLLEDGEKLEAENKDSKSKEQKMVNIAYFIELLKKDCKVVLKADAKDAFGKTGGAKREDFEKNIEAFKMCAKSFKDRIMQGDFVPEKERRERCSKCEYKHICRTKFIVGARRI